ncbi:hypothetical protein P9738_10430 [Bacillus siamensis]|nr:hypothetical protein [Bacillus siamensis]MDU0813094.1 hypothetical protein [Bacillus siamensis]MED5048215.1 hypothetical protein [Bacillus siamensis]MED5096635.1 hypothetical protein [Bacillus siamensis]
MNDPLFYLYYYFKFSLDNLTAGQCDNCGYTLVKSSVKNEKFLRECRRSRNIT